MTKLSQDFTVYAGDRALLTFIVQDGNGTAIDISTVSDLFWNMQRDLQSAVALQKTKLGGGITFTTSGTDGKFDVALSAAETAVLMGYYIHQAKIIDSVGNTSTVTLGRGQFGRMPVSSYSGDPSVSDKDSVRFWLSDTDSSAWKLTDPEILYALTQYGNPLLGAAACARSLAAKYSSLVDKTVGPLRLSYSQRSKQYLDLAASLQTQGEQSGATLYAGGTSLADMAAVDGNNDRVPQPFSRKQFDIPNASQNPTNPDDAVTP